MQGIMSPQLNASAMNTAVASNQTRVAYKSLLILILIMFIAPMNYIPALQPFRLALVFGVFAMVAHIFSVLGKGLPIAILNSESKSILWLVFFAFLSIPHSKWPGGSFDVLFDTFLKSVIVFFLIANLLTEKDRFRGLFWALTVSAGFNALIGINNYRTGAFILGDRIQGGFSGLTSNPNDLALSLDIVLPFIWYLFLSSKQGSQKLLAAITLSTCLVCIVLTWSRQGALATVAMLLFYVWHRSGQRRVLAFFAVCLVLAGTLIFAPQGYSDRLVSTVDISKDKTGSASARWEMMKAGVRQTFEYPLGIGIGMNNLLNHEEGMGWNAGVHNVYLQISTELGLIPGILFITLLWKLIAAMRSLAATARDAMLPRIAEATACSLFGFAIAAFFAPVAYTFYFYILGGIAAATMEMERRKSHIKG